MMLAAGLRIALRMSDGEPIVGEGLSQVAMVRIFAEQPSLATECSVPNWLVLECAHSGGCRRSPLFERCQKSCGGVDTSTVARRPRMLCSVKLSSVLHA